MSDLLRATRELYEAIYRFDGRVADMLDIHRSDLRCLNALEYGPLTPTMIGERLGLTSGSVTALIDRLLHTGIVERQAIDADRRSHAISLTHQGRKRVDRAYAKLGRAIGAQVQEESLATQQAMTRALNSLTAGFTTASEMQAE
jgi:DNA-binding MarR family transcriptional regulator